MSPSGGLVYGGLTIFATAYTISVISAAAAMGNDGSHTDKYVPMMIPFGGPFAAIATADKFDFNQGPGAAALLIIDGVTQTGAAVMFVAGLIKKHKVWVRGPGDDAKASSSHGLARLPDVDIAPRAVRATWSF